MANNEIEVEVDAATYEYLQQLTAPRRLAKRGGAFAEWAKTADPENVKLLRDSIAAKILIGKDAIRKRWNL